MDFALKPEDIAFRDELRAWLEENLPDFSHLTEHGDPWGPVSLAKRRPWQKRLHEGRWAAINWPEEWGGREATVMQNFIYAEEMERAKAPKYVNAVGLWHIGPALIHTATREQQERWLPGILTADEIWCQGFSEPEAGSDLANIRTLALRDGDHYVVNGQKSWCTAAMAADWGFFLLRTDPTAIERGARHEGITAFVIDMHTPGITVRPNRDIAGELSFGDVFFEDARIPESARIAGDGDGWLVGMALLSYERIGTASLSITMRYEFDHVLESVRELNPDALSDPALRDRVARISTQLEMARLLNARAMTKVMRGEETWPEVPLAKLQWSYLAQTSAELQVDLLGTLGLLTTGAPDAVDDGKWSRLYSYYRFTSIGAGTTEIQKNIIADRTMGLPRN